MRLAFITPTAYIPEFGNLGDFHLALSHLIDLKNINEYEKKLRESGKPIILDNGLFENKVPEPLETLIEKAMRIKATHFFAPDILFSPEGTRRQLDRTIEKVKELERDPRYKLQEGEIKIAAVVQADNAEDYMKQLLNFNNDPNVDLIGLSILSIPKSFEKEIGAWDIVRSRIYLMQKMCELSAPTNGVMWKPMHLLGLGNSYGDVVYAAKYCSWIVSNDTSSAFWNGYQGKAITGIDLVVEGGKTEVKVDFETKEITEDQRNLINKNISLVKKIIQWK